MQLQRLLRAAAAVPPPAMAETAVIPDGRALLRQRERELARASLATRQMVRVGLAAACVLLVAILGISGWQMAQVNADVFAASELALTRISTP